MRRIAVVIIGRNEGERLQHCLDSVLTLRGREFEAEIVYVDSNSSDGSVAIAQTAGARAVVLNAERMTAAMARNAGWRAAGEEYVLFLDGDTMLQAGFVEAALAVLDGDARVAAVCGERRELYPEASVYNRVLDLDWNGPAGVVDYCGGDALFRRAALEEADGYDANLAGGEEPELCTRLRLKGWKIVRIAVPMAAHDLAMTTFEQYWRRMLRTGHAYAEVAARFRGTAMPLWSREAAHNRRQVFLYAGLFFVAVIAALTMRALFPLEMALLVFLLLVLRTAWKSRAKAHSAATLLLYGLHAHLQQLPIYLGQRRYWREVRETAGQKTLH